MILNIKLALWNINVLILYTILLTYLKLYTIV